MGCVKYDRDFIFEEAILMCRTGLSPFQAIGKMGLVGKFSYERRFTQQQKLLLTKAWNDAKRRDKMAETAKIIEYYVANSHLTLQQIAKDLNTYLRKVHESVSKYFPDPTTGNMTLQSKINEPDSLEKAA